MESSTTSRRLVIFWCVWLCGFVGCDGYVRYEVEDLCSSGALDIRLANNGSLSAGILKATRYISYKMAMNCRISLTAPRGNGIVISIREVGFRLTVDGMCKDWIKIQYHDNEKEQTETLCQKILDLDEAQSFTSTTKHNSVQVDYYVDSDGLDNQTMSGYPGFELTFTAYHCDDSFPETRIIKNVFQCSSGCFVWNGLTCDGHNNCGDMSDESGDGKSNCTGWEVMTFVIGGTALTLSCFLSFLGYLVWRKRMKSRRVFIQLRRRLRRRASQTGIIEATQT